MFLLIAIAIIGSVYVARNKKLKDETKAGYFIGEAAILLLSVLGVVLK